MTAIRVVDGMRELDARSWNMLSEYPRLDTSHAYLRFRECVEPGAPKAVTAHDDDGTVFAGMHGVVTADSTALFSHPWKMLTSEQFVRVTKDDADYGVRQRHAGLVGDIAGVQVCQPLWQPLTEALGDVLVVRGFDSSEILVHPSRVGYARIDAAISILAAAQELIRSGLAGGLALPFVDPRDGPLRTALARAGFRQGTLTAVSTLDLPRVPSFDAFTATLPKRLRRRFRKEAEEFRDAGLSLAAARLPDVLPRVVELEAATARQHGGTPDLRRLTAARSAMHQILSDAVHTLVAERDGRIIACGVDLVDERTYYGLVYGCDYAEQQRATAYQCLSFHGPLRYAVEHGLEQVRLGFEAFLPKLIRGATATPREMWIWLPDADRLRALTPLLNLLDERCRRYLDQLPVHRR